MSDSLTGKIKLPEPGDGEAAGDVEDLIQAEKNERRQVKQEEKEEEKDDDDVESDDDMSKEDYKEYWKQVKDSDGFDVDHYFAKYTLCGVIIPQPRNELLLNHYTPHAQIALHQYNRDNNANFKVVRLEQVNLQGICRHDVLYITFHATDKDVAADAPAKIFQASTTHRFP